MFCKREQQRQAPIIMSMCAVQRLMKWLLTAYEVVVVVVFNVFVRTCYNSLPYTQASELVRAVYYYIIVLWLAFSPIPLSSSYFFVYLKPYGDQRYTHTNVATCVAPNGNRMTQSCIHKRERQENVWTKQWETIPVKLISLMTCTATEPQFQQNIRWWYGRRVVGNGSHFLDRIGWCVCVWLLCLCESEYSIQLWVRCNPKPKMDQQSIHQSVQSSTGYPEKQAKQNEKRKYFLF